MRLATELQEESPKPLPGSRRCKDPHETSSSLSRRPDEISQHLALAAQATLDAVRVWTLNTGVLSWPQGLEELLGFTPSSATDNIGFWQRQLHPQDRARAAASIRETLTAESDHWTGISPATCGWVTSTFSKTRLHCARFAWPSKFVDPSGVLTPDSRVTIVRRSGWPARRRRRP